MRRAWCAAASPPTRTSTRGTPGPWRHASIVFTSTSVRGGSSAGGRVMTLRQSSIACEPARTCAARWHGWSDQKAIMPKNSTANLIPWALTDGEQRQRGNRDQETRPLPEIETFTKEHCADQCGEHEAHLCDRHEHAGRAAGEA